MLLFFWSLTCLIFDPEDMWLQNVLRSPVNAAILLGYIYTARDDVIDCNMDYSSFNLANTGNNRTEDVVA